MVAQTRKKAGSLGLQIALRGVPECTKIFEQASDKATGLIREDIMALKDKISEHTKIIESNPKYVAAYYNRGNVKYELKDYQGAISDFTKAIAINPQNASAYSNRGTAKELIDDLQGACAHWRKASSLGDKDAAGWVIEQCQ